MQQINYNGQILDRNVPLFSAEHFLKSTSNRLIERMKLSSVQDAIIESHYFALMSAMRVFRYEIPMSFTYEFFQAEVQRLIDILPKQPFYFISFEVFQNASSTIEFIITAEDVGQHHKELDYIDEVALYTDFLASSKAYAMSELHTNQLIELAKGFLSDHPYGDCLLLNEKKELLRATKGDIILRFKDELKLPSQTCGVVGSTFRLHVIDKLKRLSDYTPSETELSPFDIQRADEFIIYDVFGGIKSVKKYKKSTFDDSFARMLQGLI